MIAFDWERLLDDIYTVGDEQGLSQNELAAQIGVSGSVISRLLSKQSASATTAAKMCAYVGRKLDEYVTDTTTEHDYEENDIFKLIGAFPGARVYGRHNSMGYVEFDSGDRFRVQVIRTPGGRDA